MKTKGQKDKTEKWVTNSFGLCDKNWMGYTCYFEFETWTISKATNVGCLNGYGKQKRKYFANNVMVSCDVRHRPIQICYTLNTAV